MNQAGSIVAGADEYVTEWVRVQLDMPYSFGPSHSLGVVRDGRILAGVVYSNLQIDSKKRPHSCEVSIASISPRWCSRGNLRLLFAYPFVQTNLVYIWGMIHRKNKQARKFARRLGFRELCVIPRGNPEGGDMVMYQMLKKDCRWVKSEVIDV